MGELNKEYAIKVLRKILCPIMIVSVLSAMVTLPLYDKVTPKYYSAQSQFIVSPSKNKEDQVTSEVLMKQINNYSIFSYGELLLGKVRKEINNKYSFKELRSFLKVNSSTDSQIVTLKLTTTNKKDSVELANIFLENVLKEAPKYFSANELKLLSKASHTEVVTELSKTVWIMGTTMIFLIVYGLFSICIFICGTKVYFNWQISLITKVNKIHRI